MELCTIAFEDGPDDFEYVDLDKAIALAATAREKLAVINATATGDPVLVATHDGRQMSVAPDTMADPSFRQVWRMLRGTDWTSREGDDDNPDPIASIANMSAIDDHPEHGDRPFEAVPQNRATEGLLGQLRGGERLYAVTATLQLPEFTYPVFVRASSAEEAKARMTAWSRASKQSEHVDFDLLACLQQLLLDQRAGLGNNIRLVASDAILEAHHSEYLHHRDLLQHELHHGREE
jgi:hypothetical protein